MLICYGLVIVKLQSLESAVRIIKLQNDVMSMKMILCRVNCSMMIFCILCDVLKLNLMKCWLKLALRFSDAASLKY